MAPQQRESNFIIQRRRIRRVMRLMSEQVRKAREDEGVPPLSLAEMVEAACWSKAHFVRSWTRIFGEPPAATARRMRLDASAELLAQGASLAKAADAAGYSCVQAYSRAFRRQFKLPVQMFAGLQLHRPEPPMGQFVRIDELVECLGIAYDGPFRNTEAPFDALLDALTRGGSIPCEWRISALWTRPPRTGTAPDEKVSLAAIVPQASVKHPVSGLMRFVIPAGDYCRLKHSTLCAEDKFQEWLAGSGWAMRDGPSLQEFLVDAVTTIPSRRKQHLLVPIAPRRALRPPIPYGLPFLARKPNTAPGQMVTAIRTAALGQAAIGA